LTPVFFIGTQYLYTQVLHTCKSQCYHHSSLASL
jgi:hypothetical protein